MKGLFAEIEFDYPGHTFRDTFKYDEIRCEVDVHGDGFSDKELNYAGQNRERSREGHYRTHRFG